jgi:hypothetical protein
VVWILSPEMLLNLSSFSSNLFVPKSVQIQMFNFSFIFNVTIEHSGNSNDHFIMFSDISDISPFIAYPPIIYDVSVFLLDSRKDNFPINPSRPLNLTLILTSAILGSFALIVIVYFIRKYYLMSEENAKSSRSRLSHPSTIFTEDDRDSYTIHSESTISTVPSLITSA